MRRASLQGCQISWACTVTKFYLPSANLHAYSVRLPSNHRCHSGSAEVFNINTSCPKTGCVTVVTMGMKCDHIMMIISIGCRVRVPSCQLVKNRLSKDTATLLLPLLPQLHLPAHNGCRRSTISWYNGLQPNLWGLQLIFCTTQCLHQPFI